MAKNQRHIVRNPAGGWDVRKPHAKRASAHLPTQAAAEQRAKAILRSDGGGEAVVHRRNGAIRGSDTIPPAPDPFPPRDREH